MSKKTIAIIGASKDRNKFGNKAVRAYIKAGWQVFPVNPKEKEIEGLPVFKTCLDIPPGKINRVSMYVPPIIGATLIERISHRQPDEIFFNPGSESDEAIELAKGLNLKTVKACSILDIGEHPKDYN